LWISSATVAVAILLWEVAARTGVMDARFTSSPSGVVANLPWLVESDFRVHAGYTLYAITAAFGLSLVAGAAAGLVIGRVRLARRLLDPLVTIGYTTPLTAFIPVVVMFLGLGITSKIVIGLVGGVFPVLVNVAAGAGTVDPPLLRAARSFSVGRFQTYRHVIVPSVLPYAVTGARIGLGRVLIGVIITEMFGGSQYGLGLLLIRMGQSFRTDELMLLVLVVGIAGTLTVGGLRSWERRMARWRAV